ncbi:MAG: molybdopterin-dependent oxidoreductase [Blastocatellia bacterium]|nr:molybdopterin-dependent oxidoreductase [Blastocatellia bacterium]
MELVKITLNGQEFEAPKGELLIEAAEMAGIYLPRFCHYRGLTAQASCRLCVVRVDNPKIPKLQTACTMPVSDGMIVTTDSEEIETVRASMIEFLLSNHPVDCPVCDRAGECELQDQTYGFGEDAIRSQYKDKEVQLERQISPFIYNDPQRCVVCKRCTRVCEEWMDEFAITTIHRGSHTYIGSYGGWVECSDCGNCVDVCPTGTLLHVPYKYVARPWDLKQTPTVCNFCSDGCSMLAGSRNEKLIRSVARDGRGRTAGGINPDFLCALGRYTVDIVHHPERIERPMIRRGEHLIPATWDEALSHIAKKLSEIKAQNGGDSIGVISAARLLNEDQYTLKKLASDVIETKNVDFYHDEDEVDLASFFKNGSPTIATQKHIQSAETILLIGSDPNEENPLTAFSIRWAVRRKSARLLIVNSVPSRLERQAEISVRVRKGSENALIATLLNENLASEAADVMGANADDLKAIRQIVLESEKVVVVFGAELRGAALEALPLLETTLATPSTEVAAEARKAYLNAQQRLAQSTQSTAKPAINENPYSNITPQPTLEVGDEPVYSTTKFSFTPLVRYANSVGAFQMGMDALQTGGMIAQAMLMGTGQAIKALYIAGEDVVGKAEEPKGMRHLLSKLDFLVVQDIFLTETAQQAHVVLPTTSSTESQGTQTNNGSQVQLVRRAIPPVGQARPDWMITASIAKMMGHDLGYQGAVKNAFKALAEAVAAYSGLTHNQLANDGAINLEAAPVDATKLNRADIMDRLSAEIAAVNRRTIVNLGELKDKAGARLHKRYPLMTRYSNMLPLHPTNGLVLGGQPEKSKVVMFPA